MNTPFKASITKVSIKNGFAIATADNGTTYLLKLPASAKIKVDGQVKITAVVKNPSGKYTANGWELIEDRKPVRRRLSAKQV